MPIVLEKDGKYVLKIYSHLDKAVQLTENINHAMDMKSIEYAKWFIEFMKLKSFLIRGK